MKSPHLFEFEDLEWFPVSIRNSMTDYLRYFLNTTNFYEPVTPLIREGLEAIQSNRITDLCSGGGGAIEKVYGNLNSQSDKLIRITLTDKFPNINAYRILEERTGGGISYAAASVDATKVPATHKSFRTVFSGFHHFDSKLGKAVLNDAVKAGDGIGIFDGGDRNIFTILGILLFHPVAFALFTPFFKPFRFSRLVFTYLVPIIPLCTIWDGIVSIIRLYQPDELFRLAHETHSDHYVWKAGKVKNKLGMHVAYLVGFPKPDFQPYNNT